MTIALIAKDDVSIDEIGNQLTRQGVGEVSLVKMNEIIDEGKRVDHADMVILISATQDIMDAGAATDQIRQRLDLEQRLVLCMLHPTNPQILLELGANEIINPAGPDIERIVERILGHLILKKRVEPYTYDALYGATRQMRDLYYAIEQNAPLKQSVLILGETGTGKGLIAEALHKMGGRSGKLMPINCAAINREMLENELFGHVKGAYTGASAARKGLIAEAHKGTAFLDEIGDLNWDLQIRLLDVVEKNRVRQAGSNDFDEVDVRFIFATHRDLEESIRKEQFREDLYARINILVLEVPPLRERKADIPLLVEHFVERYNQDNTTLVKVQAGAVDVLFRYDWPHNVRELNNVVCRAAAKAGVAGTITDIMLGESIRNPRGFRAGHAKATLQKNVIGVDPQTDPWLEVQNRAEATYFRLLTEVAEDEKHALKLSRMSRSQLFVKLRKHGLSLRSKKRHAT